MEQVLKNKDGEFKKNVIKNGKKSLDSQPFK